MFKDKFGSEKSGGRFGERKHSDELDTELSSTVQKPNEFDGSPYGRRKLTREQPDGRRHEVAPPAQQSASVRPPSPPVPPPNDPEEMLESSAPDKIARQKEASQQALSTILNSVATKQGKREEEQPRYSFSSASSTDEMLPPPPLPVEPPPQARATPEKQLMTSTLFDRFSTKTVSSVSGKGKQTDRDRVNHSPEKTPSPTSRSTIGVSGPKNNYTPASASSYGLPSPYDYYHQPVSKKYSPEVPSHPFSPAPNDSSNKPGLSTIFQGQMTPSSTASDSPPTYKTMAKGELRSIEISTPVFVSSSNQNVRPEYEHQQYQPTTSSRPPSHQYQHRQPQPLSATNLQQQRVVYEYDIPTAPLHPGSPSSPQDSPGVQSIVRERSRPKPLTLYHESNEGARRTIEEILTQEIDQDSPSSNEPSRSSNTSSGAGRKPASAAAAVAEILANRQPLSVRISIQKHKTETSYKKSQSFGPEGQGEGNTKGNGGGGGGKKKENPFSESSL